MRSAAVEVAANIASTLPAGQRLQKKLSRASQCFVDLRSVLPGALRVIRPAAAFSANNRRDLLDQLVRLKLCRHFFRNRRNQRDTSIYCPGQKDWHAGM